MEDDLEQSSSQYESIMGRKNKIKSKTSRKGKEGKEVLESLEQSYEADLKVWQLFTALSVKVDIEWDKLVWLAITWKLFFIIC